MISDEKGTHTRASGGVKGSSNNFHNDWKREVSRDEENCLIDFAITVKEVKDFPSLSLRGPLNL